MTRFYVLTGKWAVIGLIKPATIGPPVKNCSLVEINMTNVGQMIDGLIFVCDVCLFDCMQLVN